MTWKLVHKNQTGRCRLDIYYNLLVLMMFACYKVIQLEF